ncbi:MAG TPA: cytidine deaminase [Candidatus Acidoferrales bacterium]|nr:cytidine deaminase [Candidatus Acidoferrales bacterium]
MFRIGETERKLLEAASKGTENAYVLWGFKVGAAVLAEDGQVYVGCNVESWVSGLGTCAERCAIDHAVLHGNRRIMEIAIVTNEEKRAKPRPCGVCLQYIHDFAGNSKIKILMAQTERGKIAPETVEVKTLGELLPFPYGK